MKISAFTGIFRYHCSNKNNTNNNLLRTYLLSPKHHSSIISPMKWAVNDRCTMQCSATWHHSPSSSPGCSRTPLVGPPLCLRVGNQHSTSHSSQAPRPNRESQSTTEPFLKMRKLNRAWINRFQTSIEGSCSNSHFNCTFQPHLPLFLWRWTGQGLFFLPWRMWRRWRRSPGHAWASGRWGCSGIFSVGPAAPAGTAGSPGCVSTSTPDRPPAADSTSWCPCCWHFCISLRTRWIFPRGPQPRTWSCYGPASRRGWLCRSRNSLPPPPFSADWS